MTRTSIEFAAKIFIVVLTAVFLYTVFKVVTMIF